MEGKRHHGEELLDHEDLLRHSWEVGGCENQQRGQSEG